MRMINHNITRMSVEQVIELLTLVRANILKPENSLVFTNSNAIVATIDAALTPLVAARNKLLQHQSIAKSLTETQQSALAACVPVAEKVADYGEKCAGGDRAKAQLLGMRMRKDAAPVQLAKPVNFSVSTSEKAGALDWHCDVVDGARAYEEQASPDPFTEESFALKGTSTKSKGTVDGLPSATKQWLRVRAMAGRGARGPWSDPVCRVVP